MSGAVEAASALLHMMIARVTDGGDVSRRDFTAARKQVLENRIAAAHAPQALRVCREPDAVWSYVKAQEPPLPTYESRRIFLRQQFEPLLEALEDPGAPLDDLVSEQAKAVSATSVSSTWGKALERRLTDPEGAITLARTMLESACKTILDDRGVDYKDRDDLPGLYKKVARSLKIAPSDHTEQQFKAILGACTTVVQELGSLRNRVSDSHGPGRTVYKPTARHAALAVNLGGSMAQFLLQTHEDRSAT